MRQKARATWIKHGDASTKYFYAQWKIRTTHNAITSIYTEAGIKLTEPDRIEKKFISVFKGLMGSKEDRISCLNTLIVKSGVCLNVQQQRVLIQEVTDAEIFEVIKPMPQEKAPGVDGFPIKFFTKNWEVVHKDFLQAVKQFFSTGRLCHTINTTVVTLIPQVPAPTKVKDFRHIACCTTLYKIISKVINRRLKNVIARLVGHSQSAFIEGRNIVDNILFSHEIFKYYSRKWISPKCVLKVDLRKAYVTLEWGILEKLLIDMSFSNKFIN